MYLYDLASAQGLISIKIVCIRVGGHQYNGNWYIYIIICVVSKGWAQREEVCAWSARVRVFDQRAARSWGLEGHHALTLLLIKRVHVNTHVHERQASLLYASYTDHFTAVDVILKISRLLTPYGPGNHNNHNYLRMLSAIKVHRVHH